MPRTREQDREYQKQRRRIKAAEKNASPQTAQLLTLVKGVADGNQPANTLPSHLLASVQREIAAIPAAESAAPGLSALAELLAVALIAADTSSGQAQIAAQLRATLVAVRLEARQSGAPVGKLAAMQARRKGPA